MAASHQDEIPVFGHAMLKYFALDPTYLNLNHGSYGTPPTSVLEEIAILNRHIETNPDRFMRFEVGPAIENVRSQMADFLKVKTSEIIFTINASMGVDVVLRNLEWEEGDTILAFSTTYATVGSTAAYLAERSPNPTLSVLNLSFPMKRADIIERFKEHIQKNPAKPGKKRVAIIDSISSVPAIYFPWKEMVAICKQEGILSVIDAAHAIGHEVGINLTEAGPDFWVSNCHKWLSAKRPCAVIYVPERNQHLMKAAIPTSHVHVSSNNGAGPSFLERFSWYSTIDQTTFLTLPEALKFREWMGGEETINTYCRNLAFRGGKRLTEIFGTQTLDPDGDLTLNMVNVELPIPDTVPYSKDVREFILKEMIEQNAFALCFYYNGKWWTRCSVQVWNEIDDFEKIGEILKVICKKVEERWKY